MSQPPPYRRAYDDPRLDRSYRAFVDSVAALRGLAPLTGLPQRTAARYAKRDQWVEERDERTKVKLETETQAAIVAAQTAAVATDGSSEAALAAEGDAPQFKTVALAVLKRQQRAFERVETVVLGILDEEIRKAEETGRSVAVGRLIPIVTLMEKVATNVRRAFGIPDVSKSITELTGANGEPLIPQPVMSDAERAERIAAVFAQARARRDAAQQGEEPTN